MRYSRGAATSGTPLSRVRSSVAVRGKRPTHCPVGGDGAGRQGKPSHSHGFSTPNPGSRRFVFACWVDWFVIRNDSAPTSKPNSSRHQFSRMNCQMCSTGLSSGDFWIGN